MGYKKCWYGFAVFINYLVQQMWHTTFLSDFAIFFLCSLVSRMSTCTIFPDANNFSSYLLFPLFPIKSSVIAQFRKNKDLRGFKAVRIDSKVDKPCLLPVLTIERIIANKSCPQLE
jgi:hypothetical protein